MRDNSTAIHLVGETIDAKRAHQRAQNSELIPLVRGVYVDHDGDAETAILTHAVRIAHYLYPNAYLSSADAVLLAPTPDGRLFISGRRNQRTRFADPGDHSKRGSGHPSTAIAVIGDDLGRLRIAASSPRQRFLEAFRLRSEHASAITAEMRSQVAARLVAEHGTPQAAADAVWALARERAGQESANIMPATEPAHREPGRRQRAAGPTCTLWRRVPMRQRDAARHRL